MGMMISTSGVLLRSAKIMRSRGEGSLEHSLDLLYQHLQEVKQRHELGESREVLDEFFGVWTDLDAKGGEQ